MGAQVNVSERTGYYAAALLHRLCGARIAGFLTDGVMWGRIFGWVKIAVLSLIIVVVFWDERIFFAATIYSNIQWVWHQAQELAKNATLLTWLIILALLAIVDRLDRIIRLLGSKRD